MRRLFEQTTGNPDDTDRLAFGRAANASRNITWLNFKSLLNSVLGFLVPSNNLSDVSSASTSRTNLDVYSTTEVDNALGGKMDKSANLSDVASAATSRTNLDVYSKSEVDTLLISDKKLTNVGGTSSGSPATLTIDKKFIVIVATNSNRFYRLPASPSNGENVIIKAKDGNTQDVAIVQFASDDLTADLALSQRDSIKFIAQDGIWQHVAYNNAL